MARACRLAPFSRRALRFEPLEERLPLSGNVVDHLDLAIVPQLPQSAMDLVGQQRWFFSHASVGVNMRNGMADLNASDPQRYQFSISNVSYDSGQQRAYNPPASTEPGKIYECNRSNPGWQTKLTIFQNSVNVSGWHDGKVDAVMDKFCYIDQNANSATYLSTMSTLEAAYPGTRFVYITMPLTTATNSDAVLRNQYNEAVRSYCVANNKILFDLADIEAHDPDGNEQTFESGGVTYQKLYSGYTTDGGHLNDAANLGRRQAALGWYATAALIAGVLGTPTDLALSNTSVAENLAAGTAVGTLSTVDRDAGDSFTYELVPGEGSQHNGLFQVVGSQLQTNAVLDFETTPVCQVRLRTTDPAGLTFEKSFSISVTDVDELSSLDADGDGVCGALSDGILILRYLFEPAGVWSVEDAVEAGATRTTRADIRAFLDAGAATVLDADGNGELEPLCDGILILRYLFDPGGTWSIDDALGDNATRTSRAAITAHLDAFNPLVLGNGNVPATKETIAMSLFTSPWQAHRSGDAPAAPAAEGSHSTVNPTTQRTEVAPSGPDRGSRDLTTIACFMAGPHQTDGRPPESDGDESTTQARELPGLCELIA